MRPSWDVPVPSLRGSDKVYDSLTKNNGNHDINNEDHGRKQKQKVNSIVPFDFKQFGDPTIHSKLLKTNTNLYHS